MKRLRTSLAMLLCLALVMGLLPLSAAAENVVSGEELRDSVVNRTLAIMDVDWTIGTRMAKASVVDEELAAYQAAGILPTTYFEYKRLHFPFKGVMVESQSATLEEFSAMISMDASVVDGIGHITAPNADLIGMDINTFLTDITSRVIPEPVAGLKQALANDALTALAAGADLSAASSKQAIGIDAAKAGYAKLDKGDLLLAWDDNADAVEGGKPRIHALVVKEIKGEQVTVMYPAYSQMLWNLECDKCGATDTEGPTSAALPVHVTSSGYSFKEFKKHSDTHATDCSGRWQAAYATTWRTETVGFDALYADGVPYAGEGYLPYTLKAYSDGLPAADIQVETDITPDNYLSGFAAKVSSDYRITSVKAVLSREGQVDQVFMAVPALGSKSVDFADGELDYALRVCPSGTTNNLSLFVRSGPMNAENEADGDYRRVFSMDFTVGESLISLSADKTGGEQGETFNVSVNMLQGGVAALKTEVVYDPAAYTLELEQSRAKNPGATITDQNGVVLCERYGSAMSSGARAFELVFHIKRTGDFPVAAEKNGQIYAGLTYISDKSGATQSELKAAKPDATPIRLNAGYDSVIYKDYADGKDLLLVFTATAAQRNHSTDSATKLTYDGKTMYDVTSARYMVDEGDILRVYAYITDNVDVSLIAEGSIVCDELVYTKDVNQSGLVDVSDVQAISNIIRGGMPLAGNELKWLMADIDRNGKVDVDDQLALWNELMD